MNYILFFPDEMRAESLHCYGCSEAITPNMDALAASGTRFDKAYTAHPVCTASRQALVTGCYPHVHGFRSLKHYLTEHDHTFVKDMRLAGYRTMFSGKFDCWQKSGSLDAFEDFDTAMGWRFFDIKGLTQYYEALKKDPPAEILPHEYNMLKPPKPDSAFDELEDTRIVNWACGQIRDMQPGERPFFMMLSLNNPHPVYETLEKYASMYDPDQLTLPRNLDWLKGRPAFYELTRKYRELEGEDEKLFRKVYATYLGMITYVDELLGRLMQTLRETGRWEDTAIIVCSDHGDFAGNAGLVEKWPSAADDMITRVPLIMRFPGQPAGQVIHTPVSSMDIFPTIFEDAGLTAGHQHFGVSLLPQVKGAPGDASRVVYTEGGYDTSEMHTFEGTPLFCMHNYPGSTYYPKMRQEQEMPESVCRMIMQRDDRYKLVMRTNQENELYDMEADPKETRNLYHDPAYDQTRQALETRMLYWLMHTSDTTPYEGHVPEY